MFDTVWSIFRFFAKLETEICRYAYFLDIPRQMQFNQRLIRYSSCHHLTIICPPCDGFRSSSISHPFFLFTPNLLSPKVLYPLLHHCISLYFPIRLSHLPGKMSSMHWWMLRPSFLKRHLMCKLHRFTMTDYIYPLVN